METNQKPWRVVIYEPDAPAWIAEAIREKLQSRVDDGSAGPTYAVEMDDPEGGSPLVVAFVGNGPKGEKHAHRIAAVNDLYDAAVEAVYRIGKNYGDCIEEGECFCFQCTLRAAIAKADKGGQR